MIIDAHFHTNFQGYSHLDVIDYLDRNNIDKCWLFTWEEEEPEIESLYTHLSVYDVLEAYNKYPDRIIPFYAPDPNTKNLEEVFKKYANAGIKGVGELKVKYRWDSQVIIDYLKVIEQIGFPLVFHMETDRYHYISSGNNWFDKALDIMMNGGFNGVARKYIERFIDKTGLFKNKIKKNLKYFPGYLLDFYELEQRLQEFPNINFVAHGPHFWNNMSANPDKDLTFTKGKVYKEGVISNLLENYDNLYADISGKSGYIALTRDSNYSKPFMHKYYDKLLFGTDNHDLGHYEVLKSFQLPKGKENKILFENAEKLIGI